MTIAPPVFGGMFAQGDAHGASVASLLAVLAAIFVATKVLGELAQRLKQPSVLGELLAGVLLGGSVLGVVDPKNTTIEALAQVGVVVLLFATGLHTNTRQLAKVGGVAITVAVAGVVLPFVSGYFVALGFGLSPTAALVCGAAMCATSVGISARVLTEIGVLDSDEGRVVLGAAVFDDIIGLIILSVVGTLVAGQDFSVPALLRIGGVAIGFVVVAVLVGTVVAKLGYRAVQHSHTAGTLGILALAFAFALAWWAQYAGSAMIVGAFAAGLVLDDRHDRAQIEQATTVLGHFFVPIFFAWVGAQVDLRALANPQALMVGGALIACGVAGKVLAGYAPFWFRGNKLLVGVAMMPRGEVGLIFATMGLTWGAINPSEFGALMLMVMVTTLIAPPLLGVIARRTGGLRGNFSDDDASLDIDDVAAGVWPDEPLPPAGTPRGTKVIRRSRGA
jgi:Kef-type K+ transport system membrane component KefB